MDTQIINIPTDPIPEACGIYILTHSDTSDSYVGQAENIRARVRGHLSQLGKLVHPNSKMNRLAEDRGASGFEARVLELCEENQLNDREQHYIANLKPTLNSNKGGGRGGWRSRQEMGPITFQPNLSEIERFRLDQWAEEERRTVPDQIAFLIEQIVRARGDDADSWPRALVALRRKKRRKII